MITLAQLSTFLKAAELEHFSRAAAALHLTQPAVTANIRGLERVLGVRLFEVRGRRVYLTEAGRLLRERAAPIIGEVAATERALREYAALGSGRLALGATRTIGGYVLPPLLAEFQRAAPRVTLDVAIENTAEIERRLLARDLDLALVEGVVADPDLETEPFRRDELVLLVPPDDPLAAADAVDLADLRGRSFIWREPGSGTRELAERALAPVLAELRTVLVLNSPEAILRAVEAGLGLAVQSALVAERDVAAGRLRALRVRDAPMQRAFSLVLLHGRSLSPAAALFLRCVRASAAG